VIGLRASCARVVKSKSAVLTLPSCREPRKDSLDAGCNSNGLLKPLLEGPPDDDPELARVRTSLGQLKRELCSLASKGKDRTKLMSQMMAISGEIGELAELAAWLGIPSTDLDA